MHLLCPSVNSRPLCLTFCQLDESDFFRWCICRVSQRCINVNSVEVIYQEWDAVFHHQMKHWEESWKYDVQWSIFEELWDLSPGDETLCQMLDITSQTKWF